MRGVIILHMCARLSKTIQITRVAHGNKFASWVIQRQQTHADVIVVKHQARFFFYDREARGQHSWMWHYTFLKGTVMMTAVLDLNYTAFQKKVR